MLQQDKLKSTISKSRFIYPLKDENDVELPEDSEKAISSLFESRRKTSFVGQGSTRDFSEANERTEKGKYCLQLKQVN